MEHQQVDAVVCLGDIAAGGPDPRGAIDRIADLGWTAVRGNIDVTQADMPGWWRNPTNLPRPARPGMEVSVWGVERLERRHRRWLSALPPTASVGLGDAGALHAFHGSPRSADEMITDATSDEDLATMCGRTDARILAGGHTHVPMLRMLESRTVINPGSVGMPFAGYGYAGGVDVLAHAAYAIVDVIGDRAAVEFHQVDVDRAALESSVEKSGMPHRAWWLGLRAGD